MNIIKRDGTEVVFDINKIIMAITKANNAALEADRITEKQIQKISDAVEKHCAKAKRALEVEEIQNLVENELMSSGAFNLARRYITYRYERAELRRENTTDKQIMSLIDCKNEVVKQENSNKNPTVNSVQRDYMAGEVSKDLTKRKLLPADIYDAHEKGIIHFHDADYFAQRMHNCDLINLEDMLQNGTVISGTRIDKPHSFSTACNIATQIIAQVASNQYGGQSITLSHLAPFVNLSRETLRGKVRKEFELAGVEISEDKINQIAERRVHDEIDKGVQTIQYQVVTLMTTNGQAPFVTVFMYLNEVKDEQTKHDLALIIEEILKQRIKGVKNEKGVYITPAFPKLIYALEEDNIHEDSKYYYLTELAAKCTAKRMVPDYISEKVMKELKEGTCFPSMGCRSFLTPWKNENGEYVTYSRFNKGVVTINLVDVACSAKGDNYNKNLNSFWSIFEERLELCHRALLERYYRLRGTPSDVAPILWQNGAIARLEKGETIDKLLVGGFSTISLGYAGLWECVTELIGKTLMSEEGQELGLQIMKKMNEKCDEWNKDLNLGFGIYGTPLESTTYKFAKCLQQRFDRIPGVTDKNYITNSYHIHVTQEVDAFSKLSMESKFQKLSTGGAISYVEVPNLAQNIPAVLQIMKHIYNNIMYAEINTKSDFCHVCKSEGEIKIVHNDAGKLVWECPNCQNRDQDKMNVARRTCGYIGTNFWNQGRTQEIKERKTHL